jgi:hypothetical protein
MDATSVTELTEELAVILATSAVGGELIPLVCLVVERCHHAFPSECEAVLERLLEQAAAYHRVRLRCLLMMLRNPPADLATSFSRTFTHGSSAEQISAW